MVKSLFVVWLVLFGAFFQISGQNSGIWEYWFNNDYDARTISGFNFSPGSVEDNYIPTDGLDAGMHTLHFRFRDSKGLWSVPQSFLFFKGGQRIWSFEYWFNDDYNDKDSIETNRSESLQFNTALEASHLANGMHWIHFRFRDASGIYGPVQSHLFWKTGQKLVAYEYWFDENYTNRITGQIAGVKEETWIKLIEIDAIHFEKIFTRYKDSGGLWSSVVSLDVPESVSALALERHQFFSVYPNPVAEKLNISYLAEIGESAVFAVYDMQGKKVLIQNFGASAGVKQNQMIDVTRLINGIYICIFESGNERTVFKAVINR